MRVRFSYRAGVEDEIARERGTLEALDDAAEDVATAAKGYAPVRTGAYRTSIAVRREDGKSIAYASVPYAAYVEWGTIHAPDQHPLARGLETVSRSI